MKVLSGVRRNPPFRLLSGTHSYIPILALSPSKNLTAMEGQKSEHGLSERRMDHTTMERFGMNVVIHRNSDASLD